MDETTVVDKDHAVIPLLGRFTLHIPLGTHGWSYFIQVADSAVCRIAGQGAGKGRQEKRAGICDAQGRIAQAHHYDRQIMERLIQVQATIPGAIQPDMDI